VKSEMIKVFVIKITSLMVTGHSVY